MENGMGTKIGMIKSPAASHTAVTKTTGTKIGELKSPAASHTKVTVGTKIGDIKSPAASQTVVTTGVPDISSGLGTTSTSIGNINVSLVMLV